MKITRKELRRLIVETVLNEDTVKMHTVKKGETLSQIYSRHMGVSLSSDQINQLVQMQNDRVDAGDSGLTRIESADSVKAGDKILLPGEQTSIAIGAM